MDELRCWLCRRTGTEVSEAVARPSDREKELDTMNARVNDSAGQFERESKKWALNSMEHAANLEFTFVLNNPEQFKMIAFMPEVIRAKKSLADSLVDAAGRARSGTDVTLGIVTVPHTAKARMDFFNQELSKFEKSSGRKILADTPTGESGPSDDLQAYEGLKLKEGIAYLAKIGLQYYAIQKGLIQKEKEEERAKRPVYKVSLVKVPGHPTGLPLCSVCELLVK